LVHFLVQAKKNNQSYINGILTNQAIMFYISMVNR
jgi:hypothetical protein